MPATDVLESSQAKILLLLPDKPGFPNAFLHAFPSILVTVAKSFHPPEVLQLHAVGISQKPKNSL